MRGGCNITWRLQTPVTADKTTSVGDLHAPSYVASSFHSGSNPVHVLHLFCLLRLWVVCAQYHIRLYINSMCDFNLCCFLHQWTLCDVASTHRNMCIFVKQIYIILCCFFASAHTACWCKNTHRYVQNSTIAHSVWWHEKWHDLYPKWCRNSPYHTVCDGAENGMICIQNCVIIYRITQCVMVRKTTRFVPKMRWWLTVAHSVWWYENRYQN